MISMMFAIMKPMGEITAAVHRISRILKILEPTTFPTAISSSFFRAATIDVTSSGRNIILLWDKHIVAEYYCNIFISIS